MPLWVRGRDAERELIGTAFDDGTHWNLCAIMEDLFDIYYWPLVINLDAAAVDAAHRYLPPWLRCKA